MNSRRTTHLLPVVQQDRFHRVAPDVVGLTTGIVNLYFVGPAMKPGDWLLVDAGLAGYAGSILRAAEKRFGINRPPTAIVLTHGHFDHVGALRTLAEKWNVPIYAHRLELPYLTGKSSYPPPDPTVGGGLMPLLSPAYPRGPIDLGSRVHALPEDGSIPGFPDWRWHHTPGHTAGHISLHRASDGVMIAGDAFITVKQESFLAVMEQRTEMSGPPSYFTPDWPAAGDSVRLLAALKPQTVATGHGRPLTGRRMQQALLELARDFEEVAVPAHGRYTHESALMDERGVISIPAAPARSSAPAWIGLGLAFAAFALVWTMTHREET